MKEIQYKTLSSGEQVAYRYDDTESKVACVIIVKQQGASNNTEAWFIDRVLECLLSYNFSESSNSPEDSFITASPGIRTKEVALLKKCLIINKGQIVFQQGLEGLDDKQTDEIRDLVCNKRRKPWNFSVKRASWKAPKVIGIFAGVVLLVACGSWLALHLMSSTKPSEIKTSSKSSETPKNDVKPENPVYSLQAEYDPNRCMVYFKDNRFDRVKFYIDSNDRVKKLEDIPWSLNAQEISISDTLFLKNNCKVYIKGYNENDEESEIHVITVNYNEFITALLATHSPLLKEMLITGSSLPFGNTTFQIDGNTQQVSYYGSSELDEKIKSGYVVTEVRTSGGSSSPLNRNFPKLKSIKLSRKDNNV